MFLSGFCRSLPAFTNGLIRTARSSRQAVKHRLIKEFRTLRSIAPNIPRQLWLSGRILEAQGRTSRNPHLFPNLTLLWIRRAALILHGNGPVFRISTALMRGHPISFTRFSIGNIFLKHCRQMADNLVTECIGRSDLWALYWHRKETYHGMEMYEYAFWASAPGRASRGPHLFGTMLELLCAKLVKEGSAAPAKKAQGPMRLMNDSRDWQ